MEIQRELIDLEDEEYLQGIEKSIRQNGARTSAATSVIHQKHQRQKSTVTMWKSNRNPAPALSRTTYTQRSVRKPAFKCHVSRTAVQKKRKSFQLI